MGEEVSKEETQEIVIKDNMKSNLIIHKDKYLESVDEEFLESEDFNNEVYEEMNKVKEAGVNIPDDCALIYGEEHTTRIYAKRVAKNGDNGKPVLYFRYTDGRISSKVPITLFEIFTVVNGNYGKKKNINGKEITNIDEDDIDEDDIKEAKKTLRVLKARLMPFWDVDLSAIKIPAFIELLYKKLPYLHIDRSDELDIDKIYSTILKYVETNKIYPGKEYLIRKGFYAFLNEDMFEIATSLNSTIPEIIEIIKNNNLLYLQKSSKVNQCAVKGLGSAYCIRMLTKYRVDNVVNYDGDATDLL